jgi:hypothetical protein
MAKNTMPKIFDASKVDRVIEVSKPRHTKRLALEEGVLQE